MERKDVPFQPLGGRRFGGKERVLSEFFNSDHGSRKACFRAMVKVVKDLNAVAHPQDEDDIPLTVADVMAGIKGRKRCANDFTSRSLARALGTMERLRHGLLHDNEKNWVPRGGRAVKFVVPYE